MSKGSFVSPETRTGIRARIEPIALAMARAGLTPNMLTLIGFAIASAGGVLAALDLWILAGIVATVGSGFDMFDGAVARATGTTSPLGAFMDSVFDRWGEGVIYVGIVIGATQAGLDLAAWLSAAAMVSAFMVSYARSKSETNIVKMINCLSCCSSVRDGVVSSENSLRSGFSSATLRKS